MRKYKKLLYWYHACEREKQRLMKENKALQKIVDDLIPVNTKLQQENTRLRELMERIMEDVGLGRATVSYTLSVEIDAALAAEGERE